MNEKSDETQMASRVLRSTEVPGVHGEIRRCWDPDVVPTLGHYGGAQTLYEAFRHGAELNPLGPCLGFRAVSTSGMATPYIYSSYSECLARVNALAAGLDVLQLLNKTSDYPCLGLYLRNCMEWVLAEHAVYSVGGVTVPLYDTLGPDTACYILQQTQTKTVVCTRKELANLCQAKQNAKNDNRDGGLDCFTTVLLVDGVTRESASMAEAAGLEAMAYAKVEAVGARALAEKSENHSHSPPSPNDLATFCYTSGTTDVPKGAMLTHRNMISAMMGTQGANKLALLHTYDRHLSYLPLAHIFERVVLSTALVAGAAVAFHRGQPQFLIEDLQACRPTIMIVVPRVLNKIYDKIMSGFSAAGGYKKKLFDTAVATKTKNLIQTGRLTHALYDRLIFNKIKKGLGMDQLRGMISGSAPLADHVLLFFRVLLGIPIGEGYGQTEGAASATLCHPNDHITTGSVGGPTGSVEIALFDVPEMGYYQTDRQHAGKPCHGRGEICIRGPNVFVGYYKDEEKTKETIDADGWLHSGDIGLWRPDGSLQIIDRKKNLFKLSHGEYVAPEKIENILTQSRWIAQCFVYGDSLQNSLVAIVVPDEETVTVSWQTEKARTFQEICQLPELKEAIMKDINFLSKKNGFNGFEYVRAIHLEHRPFTVDNNLLTPTFKLKRQQCREAYQKEIELMYANEIPLPQSKL